MIDSNETLNAFLSTALWSSQDISTDGEYMDAAYDADDFTDAARAEALTFVESFIRDNSGTLEDWKALGWTDSQIGHDLWLTMQGHGAGFWDRHWREDDPGTALGKAITSAAKLTGSEDQRPMSSADGTTVVWMTTF